jgi:signal transduction histidine kinase
LLGTEGVKRDRSLVSDSAGRIWVSTNRGISVVNPAWLVDDLPTVIPHIQAVVVDGDPLAIADTLQVPARRKRIIIGYVGLSLSFPERVMFRYKLDGFDQDWTQPMAAREAVYTNLEPRSYRFHVTASNDYGVWNSPEVAMTIQVEPSFWQTWWFRLTCGVVILVASAGTYVYRLSQISSEFKLRLEERLAERTRIAQEIHDTLLQGFLSASMQLHVARGRLPADSPAMPPLSRAIDLIQQSGQEGRMTLRGLRSPQDESMDLVQAFSCLPREFDSAGKATFQVKVVGSQRPLQPLLRDEVYRIGREALVNAFRHSRGTQIELELDFEDKRFGLVVRDDGTGIDPGMIEMGRDGHWGLRGMRERAEKIGAKLSFWSSSVAGTEVILSVPAHLAYQSQSPNGSWRWILSLFALNFNKSQ